MLTEEELTLLTAGEDYCLEAVGGGFQGRHLRLICGSRVLFIKTRGEAGGYDTGAFVKEPLVYRELLPALEGHMRGQQLWPRLVLAREGLLVLQDLSTVGWQQEVALGPAHVVAALEALADLHGASILLDQVCPLLERFQEALVESYFGPPQALCTWAAFRTTAAKVYSKYFPGRKWGTALALLDQAPHLAAPSAVFRNCLCHGDPWPNNIFFKYTSGLPDRACFVDFAQVRYCPPATDVLLFLRLLQTDDIDGYLHIYHSRLALMVPSFTLEEFLESCVAMDRFALCVAPLYVYLTKLPPLVIARITETPADFTRFAMGGDGPALQAMDEDMRYRTQVVRAFKELLDYGESVEPHHTNEQSPSSGYRLKPESIQ